MRLLSLALAVALFFTAECLSAQQPPLLEVGQRVRVTAPQLEADRLVGELLWLDLDSLVLDTRGVTRVVPRHFATHIDVSRGRRRHVLAGLAAGATVGLGAAVAAMSSGNYSLCRGSGDYLGMCRSFAAGSITLGAGLGAAVGAFIRSEGWVPVPFDYHQPDLSSDALKPGQIVRVRVAEGEKVEDAIVSLLGDSLVVTLRDSGAPLSLLTVDSLWVKDAVDATAIVTPAIIGAAIGAIGTFLASIPSCEQERSDNPSLLCGYSGMTRVQSVAGGAAVGALVGSIIGLVPGNWQLRYTGAQVMGGRMNAGAGFSLAVTMELP